MLQHVALETRPADVDAVAAFWELLGFARTEEPPTLRGLAVWLERGASQIHLLLTDEPVVPPAGHAAVVVDDYPATIAALRARGVAAEPRTEHWGVPRTFVTDPAGHRIELMAAPPPARG
jgi:catechol 2,3-dioxygenase-like lactoylglutathione lyase family enzyme